MNLSGKTILITGSTDGVGRRVAERAADAGALVLLHGRNRERGEKLRERINAGGKGRAEFYRADFASLAAVRRLAASVRQDHGQVDILLNSAGLGSGPDPKKREESADGFELRFAVNYLSHFLLTHLLLQTRLSGEGAVKVATPQRIVNVASLGQQAIDFGDVMLERGYDGARAYRQSKLAQVLFTFDLAEQVRDVGITVNSLHPATFMDTTMVRQAGTAPVSTVDQGADAILNLVASPLLEGRSGLFFNGLQESRANDQAYDADARRRLRELSERLTGLSGVRS